MNFSFLLLYSLTFAQFFLTVVKAQSPVFNKNYAFCAKNLKSHYSVTSRPQAGINESAGVISVYNDGAKMYEFKVDDIVGKIYLVTNKGDRVIELYVGIGRSKVPNSIYIDPFGIYFPTSLIVYDKQGKNKSFELGNSLSFYLLSQLVHEQNIKRIADKLSVDDSCLYVYRNYTAYRLNSYSGKLTNSTSSLDPGRIRIKKCKIK